MYAAIDIGGTKTLAASLDDNGVILQKIKFKTPQNYDQFLEELRAAVGSLEVKDFRAGGIGAPVTHFDRRHGRGIDFSNLDWHNVPLLDDIEAITKCPMVLDNDAKLAGLSEAMLVKETYSRVLYVTVSTGIGMALVVDKKIDENIGDGGGRTLLIEHQGKLAPWESFASGSAIVRRYGSTAEDLNDKATWIQISRDLAKGFIELIALTQPEVIIIGGSVGTHYKKYGAYLTAELKKYETPFLKIPPIQGAGRPEEAVVFGCYDLAKTTYAQQPAGGAH